MSHINPEWILKRYPNMQYREESDETEKGWYCRICHWSLHYPRCLDKTSDFYEYGCGKTRHRRLLKRYCYLETLRNKGFTLAHTHLYTNIYATCTNSHRFRIKLFSENMECKQCKK